MGGGGEPALGPLPETGLRIAMGPFAGDISTQVGWFHGVSIVYWDLAVDEEIHTHMDL